MFVHRWWRLVYKWRWGWHIEKDLASHSDISEVIYLARKLKSLFVPNANILESKPPDWQKLHCLSERLASLDLLRAPAKPRKTIILWSRREPSFQHPSFRETLFSWTTVSLIVIVLINARDLIQTNYYNKFEKLRFFSNTVEGNWMGIFKSRPRGKIF